MCAVVFQEKCISLIKDVKSSITAGVDVGVLSLTPESVNLEQRTDTRSKVVSKYFQEQLETNPQTCPLGVWAYNRNLQTEFVLAIRKDFMQSMCNLLPQPFLRIRVTLDNDGTRSEKPIEFEKDFKLNETLIKMASVGNQATIQRENIVVSNPHPISTKLTCLMDVHLGWRETKEVAQICTQSLLERMLEDESSKDLTLVAGNGAEIKCHQNVFAAHTPTLSAMLSANTGMRESRSKRVELQENSEDGLRHLINYLYGMQLVFNEMSSDLVVELFQTAHKYGLSQLEESLLQVMLKKDVECFTPDALLELYFFVRNLETEAMEKLRDHSLHLLATMDTEELRSCAEFSKLKPAEITDLSFKIIKFTQEFVPRATAPGEERSRPGWSGIKRRKT